MAIGIVPYEPQWQAAARAFDDRMRTANALPFPIGDPPSPADPAAARAGVRFHHFLAVDGEGAVRGAYFIRTQPFLIRGRIHTVGHYSAPVSEGIVNKRFAAVGAMMLGHALARQPLLFAMGMGALDRPLPRMLKAMGWTIRETPFLFRVLNARAFLKNAAPLRTTPLRRFAAAALSLSGAGPVAIHTAQRVRTRGRFDARFGVEPVLEFDKWADRVWDASAEMFSFSAVRNSAYLQFVYPDPKRYAGFRLNAEGSPAAWAQLLDCSSRNAPYFGSMKVMALIDCVGPAASITSVIAAATRIAGERGADLLFSNQLHVAWTSALRAAGFWQGPSNYLLALSKPLVALLEPLSESEPLIHFNRGDGDGSVNLLAE